MRLLRLQLVALMVAIPATSSAQGEVLFSLTGLDYETGLNGGADPTPAVYLQTGDFYEAIGLVSTFGDRLAVWTDPSVNQYSFFLSGLQVTTRTFFAGVLSCTFDNDARIRLYSDPVAGGTPADYGVNPRNATVPSSFTDGLVILGGRVDASSLIFNQNSNQGSFEGTVTWDEGTLLDFIQPAWRSGWTLALGLDAGTTPGYDNEIQGDCGSSTTAVTPNISPRQDFSVSNPHPQPALSGARFDLWLPEQSDVRFRVFDASGRMVSQVCEGGLGPGAAVISWQAMDPEGRRLRPGVYYAEVETGRQRATRRLVICH